MLQTGKSQEDALFEVEDTIECLRHFAGYSDKLAGQAHTGNGLHAYTQKEPYGTVGLITSFNYPLLLTGWKLAPSLAAGNCAIVKPAPQTPLTTLALAGLATDILPAGVLSVLPGGAEIGQAILKGVDKISFTGSTAVGQSIMREAAATLTPITLECGGKNAAIVLADADLDEAARHIASGAFSNAGQNCCAVSRVLVSVEVHDTFLDKLSQHLDTQDWGPLIDQTQYERVLGHIERATESPAFVGPRNNDGQSGYYVPPTVFTQVDDHSPLARQEIFGPVLSILKPFRTIEEAIGRANNSPYGLAAGVFTKDYKRAHSIVPQLKAGVVWVNTYNLMPSFLPFGGVKMSGIGKDLGQAAMNEFTIEKSVMFGLT
ncbi:aldehyde dehydrogenase domain-containing protein [Radiomyces spectabilis]|uniref:aldehyde dehydrogenase domain-containing protein n=1 Tax=Radiomyces spectabilis TaxID=64574 RepID=UPI00221FB030|nr:aldehyde dehydrogenase domain-containing protein [Radiomyces spectabilis]KAI8388081.1 aldehyde dehydrogenase domain-containing protein [Radiomyces spectabilis]